MPQWGAGLTRAVVASMRSVMFMNNGQELSSVYHRKMEAKLWVAFAKARAQVPCIIVLYEIDMLTLGLNGMGNEDDSTGGQKAAQQSAEVGTVLCPTPAPGCILLRMSGAQIHHAAGPTCHSQRTQTPRHASTLSGLPK
ncbi:hypothetical protein HYPSUDRAFT_207775 [Hypholoma sublateritium FD-334 SS-4]|uniref:ATPase AAA-type core domain-containing protein n=1 Tax=Hypholoma sublateritium (strain FD-334 SS-4) TaxID=945553 RepID=A0A0D2LXF1_HYPSF|nr:hypothetical protein HYPSUDRAFT_207775 [Hypholoma sublateritium FD-334 SS-4]